jgi:hypothetical protein
MTTITKKQVCACTHCGNESEMVVTCSLPEAEAQTSSQAADPQTHAHSTKKVKGTATCSHCGNEADMWIDL